jgi:hypothetical protein
MKTITKISGFALMLFLCGFQTANAQAPTQSAPTPRRAAANVKSLYSDAYTPFNNMKLADMPWGQATVTTPVKLFGTDNMLKMTNFNWVPISLSFELDISDMDSIHMDVFLGIAKSHLGMGFTTYKSVDGTIPEVTVYSTQGTPDNIGSWVSLDVALKEFEDQGQNCKKIDVLRVLGSGTVYLDNIYAYKGSATGISEIENDKSLKIYPTVVTNSLNIESTESINKINIFNTTGQTVGTFNAIAGKSAINLSYLNSGSYIVSTRLSSGRILSKRIIKL